MVLSTELEGGQIHLNVEKAFNLHKLKQTLKEDMFIAEILYRAHAAFLSPMSVTARLYQNHSAA